MTDPTAKIFPVETRFRQMALRPGGVPRDKALTLADQSVEDMKPGFDIWLEGELRSLAAAISEANAAANPSAETLERAAARSRAIHDVATTMGLKLVTFVTEGLTDLLQAAIAGADYRANRIDCFMEALILAKQPPYRDFGPDEVPDLAQGLRAIAGFTAPTADAVNPARRA